MPLKHRAFAILRTTRKGRFRLILHLVLLGVPLLCLSAAALSALSNRALFAQRQHEERLSPLEAALFQEIFHLRDQLGHAVWPGWDQAAIPIIMFNDDYAFLAGHPDPPSPWQPVTDSADGFSYYTKSTAGDEQKPQNFAEPVGDRWAGSLATKSLSESYLVDGLQETLPSFLDPIFPYKIMIGLMLPTEQIIAATLHESFHAYQVEFSPARFDDAELAYLAANDYWSADTSMHDAWQTEMDLLVEALQAATGEEAARLARRFLAQRETRRERAQLSPDLVDFERRFEWLEGVAMYVEFSIWRAAANSSDYQPFEALDTDPDFSAYANFDRHWGRQLDEMGRQATQENDIRFYYTGMAQSMLLDQLAPGWKHHIWGDSVWLETLLDEAVR